MEKMMKECAKPHQLLHLVSGAGLGLVLVGFVPSLSANALTLGVVLIVVGVAAEFMMKK